MSPYPPDPVRAVGPMRVVLTTYPSRDAAIEAAETVLRRDLAACANIIPVHSRYWWKGNLESADESMVLFKTVPKRVGALVAFLETNHPYEVPEVAELDVPRVGSAYLRYLAATLDPGAARRAWTPRPTRRATPRARGARAPGRTRVPHRRRSR